jgi:hypothetical protein
MEQVELVAQIGLVAAALNGGLTPTKSQVLGHAVRLLPGMRGLSERGIDALVASTADRTERGPQWLCETTHRIRSEPLRRLAFRLATLLCVGDEGLDEQQQGYLTALASGFGFSDREVERLVVQALGLSGRP